MLDFDEYRTKLEYPTRPKIPRLGSQPTVDQALEYAHSSGLSEVYDNARELLPLIKD